MRGDADTLDRCTRSQQFRPKHSSAHHNAGHPTGKHGPSVDNPIHKALNTHPNSLQGRHSPPSPHNRTNLRSPTARTSLTNPDNPTAHRRATTGPAETTVPATIPGRRSKAITGLAAIRDSEARAPNAPATVRPLLRPRALIRARCVPTCHRLTHGTALLHLPDGVFPVRGVRSARYWASHSAPP